MMSVIYGYGMGGALKPWHFLCLLVTVAVIAGVLFAIWAIRKR